MTPRRIYLGLAIAFAAGSMLAASFVLRAVAVAESPVVESATAPERIQEAPPAGTAVEVIKGGQRIPRLAVPQTRRTLEM